MQDCEKFKISEIDESIIKRIFTENEIKNIYTNNNFDFNEFLKIAPKYNINLEVETILNESIDNFNDMGIMQAIDNISAVLNVMNILYDNGYDFNTKKIILYGQSHGAYLSHLCNAFAPTLFSLIIDNSAWLYPGYIANNSSRLLISCLGKMKIIKKFNYIVSRVFDDKQILDLTWLYSKFVNNCNVISYQGTTDHLVNYLQKRTFCNKINNCKYIEIDEENVDNVIFKSTDHSLDADFLKLFEYSMESMDVQFEKDNVLDLVNEVEFDTYKHKYIINYSNVIPVIKIL